MNNCFVINLEQLFLKNTFMKKIYTLFTAAILLSCTVFAQNDTLLFENFNMPFDTLSDASDNVASSPSGNNLTWVNYDGDNIQDANGRARNWYWQNEWLGSDTLTQAGVLVSSSWLINNTAGAENWLILPPLYISDASAVLSWKSAPYQGLRYMDGYKVVVSVFDNDITEFTDEVFTHAQTITTNLEDSVSNGYIHATNYTDSSYFFFSPTLNGNHGLLEPHSVDLSAYAGYTIYIAFVHDSDDDNRMALDDILVQGNLVVSTNEIETLNEVSIAPNPARDFIQLNYAAETNENIDVRIFDMQGRVVRDVNTISTSAGTFNHAFEVGNLPAGTYQLVLSQNGKRISKAFIKQ